MQNVEWDLMGLSEVRRDGEQCVNINNNITFYHNGKGVVGGTGFLINKNQEKNIISYKSYSERISKIIWKLEPKVGKRSRLKIIQVYAPTTASTEEELEEYYEHLKMALDEDICKYTIIMGDMNAKIGKNEGEKATGMFSYGERNERGKRLVEFAESNKLFIMNTFFKKKESRKWTWISPDGQTKNEIDFFIIDKKDIVQDVDVDNGINTGSDHRAIKMILKPGIEKKKWEYKPRYLRQSTQILNSKNYESILKKNLKIYRKREDQDVEEQLKEIEEVIKKTTCEVTEAREICNRRNIPNEIKKLLERRRRLKRTGKAKVEFAEISKLIRIKWREWSNEKKLNELKETIDSGKSVKQCIRQQQIGTSKMISIKDANGRVRREINEIADVICEYYKNLYSRDVGDKIEETSLQECYTENKWEEEKGFHDSWSVLEEEIHHVIRNLKEGKAGGIDGITNEEIKAGGNVLVGLLCKLFNTCLATKTIPEIWKKGKLILLFKKGDRQEIKNYRPINLLSVVYKIFMAVITNRIGDTLESAITPNQTGFKKNHSTNDNILVIQQLIRKSKDYNFPLILLFIDFEKAFDRVKIDVILKTLKNRGIEKIYMNIFECIYGKAKLFFKIENTGREIEIKRGLRQGDVPSAKVFNVILDEAFSNMEWQGRGVRINGEWLNVLKFADDIVLIGKSILEVKAMLEDLVREVTKVGLAINGKKTKIMYLNCDENTQILKIGEEEIESTDSFIYLGQKITKEGEWEEVVRRCSLGWSAFNKYKHLLRSKVEIEHKAKLFRTCVLPTIIYGCETWTLSAKIIKKLRVTVRSMARIMLGITRKDKKKKQWITEQSLLVDVGKIVTERKWNWAGHIVRTKDERWSKKIIEWYPREMKRKRGRPSRTWEEEFRKVCGGVTWMRVARDRREWERLKTVYSTVWLYQD